MEFPKNTTDAATTPATTIFPFPALREGWTINDVEGANNYKHSGSHYWSGPEEIVRNNVDGNDSKIIMDRVIAFIKSSFAQDSGSCSGHCSGWMRVEFVTVLRAVHCQVFEQAFMEGSVTYLTDPV